MAFLEAKIPLDPRLDFDESLQCKFCELIRGKIFKFYPEEFLEEHPNRASFFIREFLPGKNEEEIIFDLSKMLDPDYIDPVTGEKNNEFGYQEPPDEHHRTYHWNALTNKSLRNHMKLGNDEKNISKQGSRLRWER